MKTNSILSILCVLLFCGSLFGKTEVSSVFKNQGLFTDTTDMSALSVWRRTNWYLGGTEPTIIEIFVDRDTLIDQRVCRIIKTKFNDVVIENSDLPVFYKGKKMYFYEDDLWWLMYDFTAKQGDTTNFYLSKKTELYSFGLSVNPPIGANPYKLIVEKVDTVLASDGRPLKRFLTADVDLGGSNIYGMYEMVEDIGSLFGFFGHFYIFTAEDWRYQFLCYKNESYVFPDENSCSPTSSSDVHKYNFILSPNPVSDILEVNTGEYIPEKGMIRFFDVTGKLLYNQTIIDSKNIITMDFLQPGIYFWSVEDKGVRISDGKLVKM
jgi:hypothetical protein